jgi:hypothetical protein
MPGRMFRKTVKEKRGLQGLDFDVTMFDCWFIGSSWEISVSASEGGSLNKTNIFVCEHEFLPPEYAPTNPEFRVLSGGVITISINAVLSIDLQTNDWNGHRIIYEIWHIKYPAPFHWGSTRQ